MIDKDNDILNCVRNYGEIIDIPLPFNYSIERKGVENIELIVRSSECKRGIVLSGKGIDLYGPYVAQLLIELKRDIRLHRSKKLDK